MSSFFWGYVFQIFGGVICAKLGPRNLLLISVLISSGTTILIPLARYISFDSIFIIILRIFTGVAQGFMYPACLPIIAKWAPSIERGKLTSFLAAGSSLGIIFATLITGPICQKGYWEINFIILGISDATFFCF